LKIDLSNNTLSNSCVKAIADAIGVSPSLTAADVQRNRLGETEKQMLRDAVNDRAGFDLKM
jgi:protein involved in polysaccharide export with SLBB domain